MFLVTVIVHTSKNIAYLCLIEQFFKIFMKSIYLYWSICDIIILRKLTLFTCVYSTVHSWYKILQARSFVKIFLLFINFGNVLPKNKQSVIYLQIDIISYHNWFSDYDLMLSTHQPLQWCNGPCGRIMCGRSWVRGLIR